MRTSLGVRVVARGSHRPVDVMEAELVFGLTLEARSVQPYRAS